MQLWALRVQMLQQSNWMHRQRDSLYRYRLAAADVCLAQRSTMHAMNNAYTNLILHLHHQ